MPELIFVVARERAELADSLRQAFADAPQLEVIVDRRRGERRRPGAPAADAERRRGDRRQSRGEDPLAGLGWTIVRTGATPGA